jgi:hypothetical protein
MEKKRKYTKPEFNKGWFNGYQKSGSENPFWKGDNVKPRSLHSWIKDNFEKTTNCEICNRQNDGSTIFDWSNKDHKYSRIREDWQFICRGCHIRYDVKYNGRKTKKKST